MILNYFTVLIFFLQILKYIIPDEAVFNYICGNDPYRFFSHVPCEYYQICPNGGFDAFIKCDLNSDCLQINPSLVCVVNRCCTLPHVVSQVYLKSSRKLNVSIKFFLSIVGFFIWIANDLF
uniref:Chitin-binding type-2 domain-containing protein n=1 Tax=Strongyloides venezuelensis TaxID=75913 RepID=A0A0K0F2I0_STRVS